MGKKKKNKKKQQRSHHSYSYGYDWHSYFAPVTSKQIHDTARQVFGENKYISYEAFKSIQEYDIIGDHEKSNIQ